MMNFSPHTMPITIIPILRDNYSYMGVEADGRTAWVVDPGEAAPIARLLAERGLRLRHIILTHHHKDHTGGVEDLVQASGAKVIGPAGEISRLPALDQAVAGGQILTIGSIHLEVLATPGHTLGHVSYYWRDGGVLFCGDTLFSLGCGRLLEGDAAMMWHSLQILRALPYETLLYCGHEYSLANLAFVRSLGQDSPALLAFGEQLKARRAAHLPTLPAHLGQECRFNPFLRADDGQLAAHLGLEGASGAMVFAALRLRKDNFKPPS
jgi:hydroxyacylglutathione hydrolase